MAVNIEDIATSAPGSAIARCPIDHSTLRQQKTAQVVEPSTPAIERDAAGVWHVRGYEPARTILRSTQTKQAGFKAELLEQIPGNTNPPILFLEGKPHHEQRKQTARFFTPRAVSQNYRRLMEVFADRMIRELKRRKRADLSQLSMKLAVRVAGEVVGLTNSRLPGMDRRLNTFFSTEIDLTKSPLALLNMLRSQARTAAFFYLDVKPAIEARRKQPREDVISHLLAQGYSDTEILTECITYGAAGMVTTREFISIATWHLLEQPELRQRYLAGDEDERQQILQELLRLEPVVGHLYRRATADLELSTGDTSVTIPAGSLIDLHIYAINADQSVVGEHPLAICPQRDLPERVGPAMMGFGDGHHRCPGAYIALQETDIFLQRLLRLPRLQIRQKPSISWNELIKGYEVRQFMLAVE
ncbi:MAG TPA: cytochrome P450 [Herpetosiphonaceae bacterium]